VSALDNVTNEGAKDVVNEMSQRRIAGLSSIALLVLYYFVLA
jgi:hypothetical protein